LIIYFQNNIKKQYHIVLIIDNLFSKQY